MPKQGGSPKILC